MTGILSSQIDTVIYFVLKESLMSLVSLGAVGMTMLDSFFKKGSNRPKCKTLLKLRILRIKLLGNIREIQLKQMRKDIAKLLVNGQEATVRIQVEHIIREENLMAAQEIIKLFCELIVARLSIIETQRLERKHWILWLQFVSIVQYHYLTYLPQCANMSKNCPNFMKLFPEYVEKYEQLRASVQSFS